MAQLVPLCVVVPRWEDLPLPGRYRLLEASLLGKPHGTLFLLFLLNLTLPFKVSYGVFARAPVPLIESHRVPLSRLIELLLVHSEVLNTAS